MITNNICANSMDKRLTGLKCSDMRWRRKYGVQRTVYVAFVQWHNRYLERRVSSSSPLKKLSAKSVSVVEENLYYSL
jgi:hypothetical protein